MKTEIELLTEEVSSLRKQLLKLSSSNSSYYFSKMTQQELMSMESIPKIGSNSNSVRSLIEDNHALDFNPKLNTSSYVNVVFEEDAEAVAILGMSVNLADQTVYPQAFKMHNVVINMIANLWHCPKSDDFDEYKVFSGAGTVGSTEACLLAGLVLKFRWRKWYARQHNLSDNEVLGIRPNLVISSCYQAAWEKLFKYMDIQPKIITPLSSTFTLDPQQVKDAIDDKTIGVVCIMGNHYGGQYDPVWDINAIVDEVNKNKFFQVGIHIDAASGGFIAPFQNELPAWDFRLSNVVSISTSGHKYGESSCGTGWIVWRQRENLSEHVSISVTYLGGKSDPYTLNFSRPATGIYVQCYKLLRNGIDGYQQCCANMMNNAKYIRDKLKAMTYKGKPRFIILDAGDDYCLPVVAAMLNPACGFHYNDIDLQHALSQYHWYVSGYKMQYNHPVTEKSYNLFTDQDKNQTMFRIVIKNNLTRDMINHLLSSFDSSFEFLDSVYSQIHKPSLRYKDRKVTTNHC